MLHSEWYQENPVFGEICSYVKINGTGGTWFSSNCSEDHSVICMDKYQTVFMLPLQPETSTNMSTGGLLNHTTAGSLIETSKYQHFIINFVLDHTKLLKYL